MQMTISFPLIKHCQWPPPATGQNSSKNVNRWSRLCVKMQRCLLCFDAQTHDSLPNPLIMYSCFFAFLQPVFYPWNDSVSTPKFHLLKISWPSPKAVSPLRHQPEEGSSSAPCLLHPLPSLGTLTTQGVVFISHCGVAVCLPCGKLLRLQHVEYSLYLGSR